MKEKKKKEEKNCDEIEPDIKKKEKIKKVEKDKKKKRFYKSWTFKVVIISIIATIMFSTLSEIVFSISGIIIMILVMAILIILGILFDVLAVAVTACEIGPLTAMASRKIKAAKTAIKLINNADKVASFCGDVVGDIVGIISGACVSALALRIAKTTGTEQIMTIILSTVTAAALIGSKAYAKKFAIKNSKIVVLTAARLICIVKKEK